MPGTHILYQEESDEYKCKTPQSSLLAAFLFIGLFVTMGGQNGSEWTEPYNYSPIYGHTHTLF